MSLGYAIRFGWARRSLFKGRRRVRLYDKFARFTSKGISIQQSLDLMHSRYAQRGDARAMVLARIRDHFAQGTPFSTALGPFIPAGERQLIQAGEESGELEKGFEEAKRMAEVTMKIRGALIAELAYPILLIIMVAGVLAAIAFKLVPTLVDAVPLAKWPAFSKGLYYLSQGVVDFGIWAVLLFIAAVVVALRSLPRWRGNVRERIDRIFPPWTVYRELVGSSLLIAMAALINAGVPIMQCVERLSMTATPWLKVHLGRTARALKAGGDPGPSLRTGLFARDVEDDIEDYAKTVGFESALKAIGDDQVTDAVERIKTRAASMRVLLLIVVAALLLFIYSATAMVAMSVAQGSNTNY